MSMTDLTRLASDCAGDATLRAHIEGSKSLAQASAVARAAGYEVTDEDVRYLIVATHNRSRAALTPGQLRTVVDKWKGDHGATG